MNKKGLLIKIILLLTLALIIGGWYALEWGQNKIKDITEKEKEDILECETDTDCVPKDCCHANTCVPVNKAPECKGIFCTTECVPGTLDCGQATCTCKNNKCNIEKTS